MKRIFYTLLLLAVLLPSCLKSTYPDDYIGGGFAIGSAEKIGGVSFIKTDDSITCTLKNGLFPDSVLGRRVIAEGELYKGSGGFNYGINYYQCAEVPVKEVQMAENKAAIDLQSNSYLELQSAHQTGKYLNIFANYHAAETKKHSFDFLINNATETFENNKVTIYLCRNNGGDNVAAKGYTNISSLDLTNLFERFTQDFDIHLIYKTSQGSQEKVLRIKN